MFLMVLRQGQKIQFQKHHPVSGTPKRYHPPTLERPKPPPSTTNGIQTRSGRNVKRPAKCDDYV